MKFDNTTRAEDVLAALPPGDEDDRWEIKGADFLTPSSGEAIEDKLAKQASAFANTGGGFLVLGVSKTRVLEPCPLQMKNTSMKDWIATKVEGCVEPPLRDFKVHPVPFRNDENSRIYVLEIGDSQVAPHQVKNPSDRRYYYRIDGHSKPAPHFHIELLRSRFTKAVLEVRTMWGRLSAAAYDNSNIMTVQLDLGIVVENVSFQATTQWGVHIKTASVDHRWRVGPPFKQQGIDQSPVVNGRCFHGHRPVLLPGETIEIVQSVEARDEVRVHPLRYAASQFVGSLELVVRPVSQNHTGESFQFRAATDLSLMREAERRFDDAS